MKLKNKFKFSWDLIGNIELGRPNLGNTTRLEVYRLMQFSIRDVMEKQLGSKKTDKLLYEAGRLAGKEYCRNVIGDITDFDQYIKNIQVSFKDMGIGILRIEKSDLKSGSYILTVSEDLECSGLPELNYELCVYDEGFISGILENFFGRQCIVHEVECWCTGGRTCRFTAAVTG